MNVHSCSSTLPASFPRRTPVLLARRRTGLGALRSPRCRCAAAICRLLCGAPRRLRRLLACPANQLLSDRPVQAARPGTHLATPGRRPRLHRQPRAAQPQNRRLRPRSLQRRIGRHRRRVERRAVHRTSGRQFCRAWQGTSARNSRGVRRQSPQPQAQLTSVFGRPARFVGAQHCCAPACDDVSTNEGRPPAPSRLATRVGESVSRSSFPQASPCRAREARSRIGSLSTS